jgi:hypothetical protein
MHGWCDPQWCKYLQATLNDQQFNHNSKSTILRACLVMIKSVFHELCPCTSLAGAIGGRSQKANEAFDSLLWTMVPKHRYYSSTILHIALGLSAIIYNNGYDSLDKLFTNIFSSMGYYSTQCFSQLDAVRKSFIAKVKIKTYKKSKNNKS